MEKSIRVKSLIKDLEYEFLYNKNPNSMYFLLSIYRNELNINKFKPIYTSSRNVKKALNRLLKYRTDSKFIIDAISRLINDDLNRIELYLFLEAYVLGYKDIESANKLENFVIINYPDLKLSNKKMFLLHHSKVDDVLKLKEELVGNVIGRKNFNGYLKKVIFQYCEKIIKSKIFKLNVYLNKQYKFYYDRSGEIFMGEEPFLNSVELYKIYNKIRKCLFRSIVKTSKEAGWHGINDKVLNRY